MSEIILISPFPSDRFPSAYPPILSISQQLQDSALPQTCIPLQLLHIVLVVLVPKVASFLVVLMLVLLGITCSIVASSKKILQLGAWGMLRSDCG